MTREEAIEELYRIIENQYRSAEKDKEALGMAIKALEQEPILDKIRAEINEEYRDESEHLYGQGLRRALQIIDKYKTEESNYIKDTVVINNRLKDLSERVENIEKQMKEDKEEQLKRLKAEVDYAKFRCSL